MSTAKQIQNKDVDVQFIFGVKNCSNLGLSISGNRSSERNSLDKERDPFWPFQGQKKVAEIKIAFGQSHLLPVEQVAISVVKQLAARVLRSTIVCAFPIRSQNKIYIARWDISEKIAHSE